GDLHENRRLLLLPKLLVPTLFLLDARHLLGGEPHLAEHRKRPGIPPPQLGPQGGDREEGHVRQKRDKEGGQQALPCRFVVSPVSSSHPSRPVWSNPGASATAALE